MSLQMSSESTNMHPQHMLMSRRWHIKHMLSAHSPPSYHHLMCQHKHHHVFPPPSTPSFTHSQAATHVPVSAAGTLPPLMFVTAILPNLITSDPTTFSGKCTSKEPLVMTRTGRLMAEVWLRFLKGLDITWPKHDLTSIAATNQGRRCGEKVVWLKNESFIQSPNDL